MPYSGPQVHQQLITAYNEAGARLESLRAELTEFESTRFLLEGSRDESLMALAAVYLPSLNADAYQATLAELRPTIHEIVLRKQDQGRRLQGDLDADNTIRAGQERQLAELNERTAAAIERQNELAHQVEVVLREDPAFVQLSDRAGMAQAALERAQANLDEVSQDAAKKLPAFESCRFFKYLQERKYGTPEYTTRGLTKRMDAMVASMSNYKQARRDYEFLKTTPETMRRIIAEDRAALDTVLDELSRMRDDAAKSVGLSQQLSLIKQLGRERTELLAQLAETAARCESTQSALNDLESPRCSFYLEAIELVRGWLARTDVDELRRRAQRTPEITDDQIVATLRGIDSKLDQAQSQTVRHNEALDHSRRLQEAIGRLIQRFRAAGFDVARCQFSDRLDVTGDLARCRDDRDVDAVWEVLRRAQSWGPSTMDQITAVATHPMTQVLINAMAHAAAGALTEQARRAGRRR